jgi:flagellar basal body rod protein FlgB
VLPPLTVVTVLHILRRKAVEQQEHKVEDKNKIKVDSEMIRFVNIQSFCLRMSS